MCSRERGVQRWRGCLGEVEDLRKMMESLKRMVTGQGLEKKKEKQGIKRQHWKKRRRRNRRSA